MVGKVIFLVAALSKNAKVDVSWFFAGGKGYVSKSGVILWLIIIFLP